MRNHPERKRYGLIRAVVCTLALGFAVDSAVAQYHTYAQIGSQLLAAETNYPSLCKRYDLGQSIQGRSIWALRISDNVLLEEDEPELRYVSTMHGDEVMGVEMCLNLIDYLTTNYGTIQRVTDIVDSVELWIVPLVNPDGFVAVQRGNAHGVDLNRNFPDVFTSPTNSTAGREPETAVIMNWGFGRSFTLAANFHGGALVTNYPYDGNESGNSVYTPTTDDDLFVWISEEYSRHNTPMWNSSTFYHGITNGADWYVVYGGLQDWSYRYMGGNEVTIEIGTTKIPPASQIPTYWSQNRDSMLAYIETCLIGVRGVVTDGQTDLPLAATVTVAGRDHAVFTDPDVGDYQRMLMPGTYDLTFEAPGYDPLTVENVPVASGDATRVDVSLWRTTVTYPNGGEVLAGGTSTSVTWTGNPTARFHVQYTANADDIDVVIDDGFESGTLGGSYSTGGNKVWTVTSTDSHEGSYAARSGAITHNQTTWMTRTAPGGDLSFWYRVSSESGWDFFNFYIDGDRKLRVSGTGGNWTLFAAVLSSGSHELKWEYTKDGTQSSGSDAVWVDDVQVTTDNTVWTDIIALTPPGAASTPWTPPQGGGGNCKVRVRSNDGAGTYGTWDESDTVFTVLDQPIPAVSEWGMAVMALLLCAAATLVIRRVRGLGFHATAPVMDRPSTRRGGCLMNAPGVSDKTCGTDFPVGRKTGWKACPTGVGLEALKLLATAVIWLSCAGQIGLADDRPIDIHAAAAAGNVARIDVLLREMPDLVRTRDRLQQTPLHMAAANLQTAAAERLLAAGADVNAMDRDGLTALHMAVRAGGDDEDANGRRQAIVSLLIRRGADVKAAEGQGKTPLHLAAVKGRADVLDVFDQAGADVAARDRLGRTPLHDAAMFNHVAVIDWLVSKKANVNAKDEQGDTPLHGATLRFRKEAAERLIDRGADVNAKNSDGATPLHVTGMAGPEETEVDRLLTAVAEVLITRGADVNAVDNADHTPLHYAVEKRRDMLSALLRQHGGRE